MNSGQLILPLESWSIFSKTPRICSVAALRSFCILSRSFALSPFDTSLARSTITARMRFVKPSVIEINEPVKITAIQKDCWMTGIAQAPQESPAQSVWKNISMHASTELNDVSHHSWLSPKSTLWMPAKFTASIVRSDHNNNKMQIMTPPQNIANIAIMKPRTISMSSGKKVRIRTTRRRRKIRKMRNTSMGTPLCVVALDKVASKVAIVSMSPRPTTPKSSQFHGVRKNLTW
mmetsp:Transcript_31347/g.91453  ORF Transcript_31347/g.91453 Transcript_31347/m.91453 type:complete len:233 (-) Transcript_31347:552-1250(-)